MIMWNPAKAWCLKPPKMGHKWRGNPFDWSESVRKSLYFGRIFSVCDKNTRRKSVQLFTCTKEYPFFHGSLEFFPRIFRKTQIWRHQIVPLQNGYGRKSIYPFILGDSIGLLKNPKINTQIKPCNYGWKAMGTLWSFSIICHNQSAHMQHVKKKIYIYLEPKWPCFEWRVGLLLEGSNPKTEDKQVPGMQMICIIYCRH